MTSMLAAVFTERIEVHGHWGFFPPHHPFLLLAIFGIAALCVAAVVTLIALHFGKK